MTMINGIKYCPEAMETKGIDHSKYYHKVMHEFKEYKERPRDGFSSTYYILESMYPIVYYKDEGTEPNDNKDWCIIKYFNDVNEVGKFLLWLERNDHEPEYEMLDTQGFVDSYLNNK